METDWDMIDELGMSRGEAKALHLLCSRLSDEAIVDLIGEDLAKAGASAIHRLREQTSAFAPWRPSIPRARLAKSA